MPTMDSIEAPEVPVMSRNGDAEIHTEFADFEEKLKEKYGKKATVDVIRLFARGGERKVEVNRKELDYTQIGLFMTIAGLLVYQQYQSYRLENLEYPILVYFSCFFYFLALCSYGVVFYRAFHRM